MNNFIPSFNDIRDRGAITIRENAPIWVANRGDVEGFVSFNKSMHFQAVTGVRQESNVALIESCPVEY